MQGMTNADACLRKIPIDWPDVWRQTGLRRGRLCMTAFGWGIHADVDDPEIRIALVEPPPMRDGETFLRIESGQWCFYKEKP